MSTGESITGTDKIDYETDGHVATITIDRPEKLNAMDPAMYRGLSNAWREVQSDGDVWVAIVTSSSQKAFSVGADLEKTVAPGEEDWASFWQTQEDPLINNGLEVWKPVIAAVNGYCLGGGMTLLLATDIRIAGEGAEFGLSEVKRGIVPGNGGTQRTARQLPHPQAMEFLLTGDRVEAQQAAEWGLVNRVVPDDEVLDEAEAFAKRLLRSAPLAQQAIKELAIRGRNMSLDDGIRLETSFNRHLFETADAAEGVAAFSEDREPDWQAK